MKLTQEYRKRVLEEKAETSQEKLIIALELLFEADELLKVRPTPSKIDKADLLTAIKELKDDGYSV